MTRHAAFLRGVNLGRRTVKSAELKAAFEAMGLADVKTLLASGNVLFDAPSARGLKAKIEAGLKAAFGFEVGTVLRSLDELEAAIELAISAAPDLEPYLRQTAGHRPLREVTDEVRDVLINETLARAGGSRRAAARSLATSRQLLQYLLRQRQG